MEVKKYDHIVIGAGISGLALTLQLQKQGNNVCLLEASNRPGGVLQSVRRDAFIWDRAAHTIAVDEDLMDFFREYKVDKLLEKPNSYSKVRQIAINDKLWEISNHPVEILSAKYISVQSKWKLLKEIFKKPIQDENPTVYDFFTYHFGEEISRNIISAVFSGIYAGDIQKMEMKSVMKKVFELERKSGSLIRGLMKDKDSFPKREIYGISGGMDALVNKLSESVDHVIYGAEVLGIHRVGGNYQIETKTGIYSTPAIASALPSYVLKTLVNDISPKLSLLLAKIDYQPMVLIHVGYNNQSNKIETNAFGFLCSQFDSPYLKGAIYNSDLFPDRAKQEGRSYSIFMKPSIEMLGSSTQLEEGINKCIRKFGNLTNIKEDPVRVERTIWKNAIPQFNRPYADLKESIQKIVDDLEGFYISGSYMSGVAISDCIKHNILLANSIK